MIRLHTDSLPENIVHTCKIVLIPFTIGKCQKVATMQKIIYCSINEIITEAKNKSIQSNQVFYRRLNEEK